MRSRLATYGLSLAALAAAVLMRWRLDPLLGDALPLVTLFGPVVVAVWLGGYRPAVLVAALGYAACAYLFIEPHGLGLTEGRNLAGLIAYLFTCFIMIGFGEVARTAQRQAELGRESLHTTLACIGDAVIATDSEGRITVMNAVAESLTGWTSGESNGLALETVFRIVNEQSRERVENPVKTVLRMGRIQGLANQTVLIARDGTERPIDDSAAPIRRADGELMGCVLVFRDLTERRKRERIAAEARAYAESIVDTVHEPLVVLDRELRVRSASRSFYETFRAAREETENRRIDDLGDGQWNVPQLLRMLEDVLSQGASFEDYELARDFPGIGRRVMLLNARLIHRAGNRGESILLAIEDVTDSKQGMESRARLAAIVDSSDDAIISKDLDGVIMSWNPGAERLFGYTAREAVGRPITILIPSERHGEEEEILRRLRRGERIEHYETVRRRKDGTLLDISLTVSPIADASGRVEGASKIARDITGRKQAERALKEADRRKDEFLATLAHELRNPLASISNAVHILRLAGGDGEMIRSVSGLLDRQVGQMTRFVEDLLDVSRITRGEIELRKEQVELGTVLDQAVADARPLVQSMEHTLTLTVPPQPIYLEADRVRLAQVVGNLLNNACKFTDKGGRITLTAEPEGREVVLRVRDSGIGIAGDQLPHIFEMFMQVETSVERSLGGVGIGLMLVKSLVELHGGTVEAHSEGPGRGSEFVVRLPLAAETARRSPEPSAGRVATVRRGGPDG